MTKMRTLGVWAATRVVVLTMLVLPRVGGLALFQDPKRYRAWGEGIAHWTSVPYRDFAWEYPPGAAAVVTPPAFFGEAYHVVFLALMVLADILTLLVLIRLGERLGSNRGVWIWIIGTAFMGPLIYTRYDMASALLAVVALAAVAAGTPFVAGLWLGAGIITKLWPAVLAVMLPFVQGTRRIVAGTAVVLAVTAVAVLSIGGAEYGSAMFGRHTARGLQVESLAATPVVVMHRAGAAVDISYTRSSGSWDVTGTGAAAALYASSMLTLLALLVIAVLVWRVRQAPELWLDLAATALLLLTVTGKVLSPQYVIWLLAVFGAALCRRDSPLLVPAALIAGTTVLGQVVYPAYYPDLVSSDGYVVVAALILRNLALAVAAILAVRIVWRCAATPSTPGVRAARRRGAAARRVPRPRSSSRNA